MNIRLLHGQVAASKVKTKVLTNGQRVSNTCPQRNISRQIFYPSILHVWNDTCSYWVRGL